ncbi:FG-GAP repeat domain-containing protein [Halanaerobacter jeridensis]|uniref:Fibronectin type-III domain-containing protein n=1 Tax=Halanaerobacter jeridensis TaxID=706427 RepID=A0A938XT66_9FIRM|nr:VCBS repeat-containing protein [Halanaerobacter jeridensis]MBM7557065.1 hypothetical protein [Halanaerobacter jeridensis]
MKSERILTIIALLLITMIAITACSSNDSDQDLKTGTGEAGLTVEINPTQLQSNFLQSVDGDLMSQISINQLELQVYQENDYQNNSSEAEVVDSFKTEIEGLNSIDKANTYALHVPNGQSYIVEAVLSGEVKNEGRVNDVTGIYRGVSTPTGVLEDATTSPVEVDVSLKEAKELDVVIEKIPKQVGDKDVAQMNVELSNPILGRAEKTITQAETVIFNNGDLELRPAVVQVDIQLQDSNGQDIPAGGEFGGEIQLLPGQKQQLSVDQQPYLEVDSSSVEVDETGTLTFTVVGADPEGAEVSLEVVSETKPSGANFNTETGEFSWQPDESDQGAYQVKFRAQAGSQSNYEVVTIQVNDKLEISVNRSSSPQTPTISTTSYDGTGVKIELAQPTGQADYIVYRNTTDDYSAAEPVSEGVVDITNWSDISVQQRTYYYWVRRISDLGLASQLSNSIQVDIMPPQVDSTILAVDNIEQNSIDLSWNSATDDTTSSEKLKYKLVQSTADNIGTVSEAESNGTTVIDWTANITSATVSNLDKNNIYYSNLLVKDQVGNKAIYASRTTTVALYSEKTDTSLTALAIGATELGDIDGDDDLDLIVTGSNNNNDPITKLYRNDGNGNFSEITETSLSNLGYGTVELSDIDRDEELELISTGVESSGNSVTEIYDNNGSGDFSKKLSLTGVSYSAVELGDIDKDNDLDLILTGHNSDSNPITKVYKNDGTGGFNEVTGTSLVNVQYGDIELGDIDQDDDLELIVTGFDNSDNAIAEVYDNDGSGNFTRQASLTGVLGSAVELGDIDKDSDLDLVITGLTGIDGTATAKIYTNNGNGVFTEQTNTSLTGVGAITGDIASSSVKLRDLDQDEDLDLLITGKDNNDNLTTNIYINDGTGTFSKSPAEPLVGITAGDTAIGDIDGDGDLDAVISGAEDLNNFNLGTRVYLNNTK